MTTKHQNNVLRVQLSKVVAEAAKNETILRRAQQRELALLESNSLESLCENLVVGLKSSFGLERVTVVLCDPQHEIRHLLLFNNLDGCTPPGIVFCDDLHEFSDVYSAIRSPVLAPFESDVHAKLFWSKDLQGGVVLSSVAILPIRRSGRLVGSINLGSADAARFTKHHATDFLSHLAVISAFCLENNINRAKLICTGLTDVLTGWHNRRYLETRMPEELAAAARRSECVSFLLFDVDHFKKINDQFGHDAGDQALREIARRVQKQTRLSDVAARYGGEEFVVLLPRTDLQQARVLAERIRQAVAEKPIKVSDNEAITITISVGISCAKPSTSRDEFSHQAREALSSADRAMYAAKSQGRNRVRILPSPDVS